MAGISAWAQENYRFGNNDGSKTAYTFIAANNTAITIVPGTTTFCQLSIHNTGTGAGTPAPKWQYNKNSAGWNDITTGSSVVKAISTLNLTDLDDAAQRVGSNINYTADNDGVTVDGTCGSKSVTNGFDMESLLAFLVISADVAHNDSIQLRCVLSTGTAFTSYTNTPTITVDKTRTATLSKTLGAATSSSVGTLKISGTLAKTLGVLSSSSAGALALTGSLNKTLGVLTTNPPSGASLKIAGTLAKTLGVLTCHAIDNLIIGATENQVLGELTLVSTLRMRVFSYYKNNMMAGGHE